MVAFVFFLPQQRVRNSDICSCYHVMLCSSEFAGLSLLSTGLMGEDGSSLCGHFHKQAIPSSSVRTGTSASPHSNCWETSFFPSWYTGRVHMSIWLWRWRTTSRVTSVEKWMLLLWLCWDSSSMLENGEAWNASHYLTALLPSMWNLSGVFQTSVTSPTSLRGLCVLLGDSTKTRDLQQNWVDV